MQFGHLSICVRTSFLQWCMPSIASKMVSCSFGPCIVQSEVPSFGKKNRSIIFHWFSIEQTKSAFRWSFFISSKFPIWIAKAHHLVGWSLEYSQRSIRRRPANLENGSSRRLDLWHSLHHRGTQKWMAYSGKSYLKWWFGMYPHFRKPLSVFSGCINQFFREFVQIVGPIWPAWKPFAKPNAGPGTHGVCMHTWSRPAILPGFFGTIFRPSWWDDVVSPWMHGAEVRWKGYKMLGAVIPA